MSTTTSWVLFFVSALMFVGCVVLFILQRVAVKRLQREQEEQDTGDMYEESVEQPEFALPEEMAEPPCVPQVPDETPGAFDFAEAEHDAAPYFTAEFEKSLRMEEIPERKLVIREHYLNSHKEHAFPCGKDITVGRSSGNTLVLSDPSVSGHHCVLRFLPEGLELIDLNSSNGTLLGNVRVTAPVFVKAGDHVWAGMTDLHILSL